MWTLRVGLRSDKKAKSVHRSVGNAMTPGAGALIRQTSAQPLPPHHPIPHETVERPCKDGGMVVLEEVVARPGERVAAHYRQCESPDIAGENQAKQAH